MSPEKRKRNTSQKINSAGLQAILESDPYFRLFLNDREFMRMAACLEDERATNYVLTSLINRLRFDFSTHLTPEMREGVLINPVVLLLAIHNEIKKLEAFSDEQKLDGFKLRVRHVRAQLRNRKDAAPFPAHPRLRKFYFVPEEALQNEIKVLDAIRAPALFYLDTISQEQLDEEMANEPLPVSLGNLLARDPLLGQLLDDFEFLEAISNLEDKHNFNFIKGVIIRALREALEKKTFLNGPLPEGFNIEQLRLEIKLALTGMASREETEALNQEIKIIDMMRLIVLDYLDKLQYQS